MEGYYSTDELNKLGFASVGDRVFISKKASIYGAPQMHLGHDIRIDDFCILVGNITLGNYIHIDPYVGLHGSGGGEVILCDFTTVGAGSSIYAGSDDLSGDYLVNSTIPAAYTHIICSRIVLNKHSFIGLNSVLLPGAVLGEGAVLGAMSMLKKSADDWSIYVGVPAKKIKNRNRNCLIKEQQFIQQHIASPLNM